MTTGTMHDPSEQEEAIFDAALELEQPAERMAYLDSVCAGDPELRARMERLLAAHGKAEDYFRDGIAGVMSASVGTTGEWPKGPASAESAVDEQVGTFIGRYKLLERIGEGGCGVVYMAEQSEPVRRRVALKIIKLGMDTRNVIARFEAERQALAMMDHPNIARVLDAGATETGRPYFVMELVRGVKITDYCDQNQLEPRERLDLFMLVCHAIQHAHQKGIIHRDIKPSNVLVTRLDGRPMPKVIDFGIAKAMEEPLTDKTLFTAYNQVVGTPAYMSPEQAGMNWLDVDTRSDIYSLGVLLYELLTGKTPFDARELVQSGLDGMRRTLREKEPHRPSTKLNTLHGTELTRTAEYRHLEAPKLRTMLAGDLDWIVMKALEKDRARRYETADALAMDIARYLENEPVTARPPSRLYRFRKLVRRNRATFAAGLAVATALIVGLGLSTWMFLEAEHARKNEAELRRKAEFREGIVQAALMLRDGNMQGADDRAGKLVPQQPTSEGASVLRTLAEWHVSANRWPEAVDRLSRLVQLNQMDDWGPATMDFVKCAVAMATHGSGQDYERCRRESLTRFAGTTNPVIAGRLAWLNLISPPAVTNIPLEPSIDRVLRDCWLETATHRRSFQDLKLVDFDTRQPYSLTVTGGIATIVAGGENIWDTSDRFLFACSPVSGDFECRMRVHSLGPALDNFTRVGLMVRDSPDNDASREIMACYNVSRSYQMLVRAVAGSETFSLPPNRLPQASDAGAWLCLQRIGKVCHASTSTNGADWTRLCQFDTGAGTEVPFGDPIYLGIATCAHNTSQTVTAVVGDFSISPVVPPEICLVLALRAYRLGADIEATEWGRRCIAHPDCTTARQASAHIILSMALRRSGDADAARGELDLAQEQIARCPEGGEMQGTWVDWTSARILLREARQVTGSSNEGARSTQ
jgi:serine/threonine protein kinase